MKLGVTLRTMGPRATAAVLAACARAAEEAGLADVWIPDHVAIPPDDAEGSEGHYLDPLATLAWLAAATSRIGLGTGVLNLPYRPPLPTAKAVATVQALSGNRLRLGVGVGWMKPEFRALGVPRSRRGALTDETLAFLRRCFAEDLVEAHGQPFLFRPRPPAPPILVGGAPPHALERAVRYGDGWLPIAPDPARLRVAAAELQERAREAGRGALAVVCMTPLDLTDPPRAEAQLAALREAGASHVVHATRAAEPDDYRRVVDGLARLSEAVAPTVPRNDGKEMEWT